MKNTNDSFEEPPNRIASEHWQSLGCLTTDRIISMDQYNKALWRLIDLKFDKDVRCTCAYYRNEFGVHILSHYRWHNTQVIANKWVQAVVQCSIDKELELLKETLKEYKCMEPEVRSELSSGINYYEGQRKNEDDSLEFFGFENPFADTIDKFLSIINILVLTCIILCALKCYSNIKTVTQPFSPNRRISQRMLPREHDRPNDRQEPIVPVTENYDPPEYDSLSSRQDMTITEG